MIDFHHQPFLYAVVAVAIAGFEAPVQEGAEPSSADEDFECVYWIEEGLELALAFEAEEGRYDIELRWSQAGAATQSAALALARAVPDLRCTQAADGRTLCLSRQVAWDPQVPPEEMSAVVAEMAAAGVELSRAGPSGHEASLLTDAPLGGGLRG